ncbi:MAG TPA: MFS transporter [Gemmatimonadaceae bacterium]|nr:MFS transporter [Gemmatimonadaceae bacterium]
MRLPPDARRGCDAAATGVRVARHRTVTVPHPGPTDDGPKILRALSARNYRLFFSGQSVSLIGTWITRIATSWLVYRLTGSAFLLGVVSFFGQIPTLVLAPFAGVLVDRHDRHRILVVTQVLSMLQSLALAILAFTGVITVAHVVLLQLAQGMINAFDTPARQSFVVDMIEDRAHLSNAIALNSTMVNGSRIIGPSIGGVLIAAFGEGWCFMIDAISYLAVIASLLAMRLDRRRAARPTTSALDELRDGFRYVASSPPIRTALLLLALVATMGMPYTVLMPAIASRVLHGGPHTLGFLMTASGLGALLGALYLASRTTVLGLGRVMVLATLTFGAALIAFALSRQLWLSLVVLPLVGGGMMIEMASTNTVIQTIVDERMRGRVMAFYTMAFMGTAPIGSLFAGALAARIGAPWTVFVGGCACLIAAAWFSRRLPALREIVRPIYVARGIIPSESPATVV